MLPVAGLLFCLSSAAVAGQDPPPELGAVRFERDLDAGLAAAKRGPKPAFLLFQEIPGCATCRDFGGGPLSHPLLVEAIETCFVPIAVYNNREGSDRAALERFGEPSWNNPVVRFVDGDGRDLIPRRDGVWSSAGLVERMTLALVAAEREVPTWLDLVQLELHPRQAQRAVFAMHCFWEGQERLGGIEGVIDARPGFLGEAEVIDLRFDGARLSLADLARRASELDCAGAIHLPQDAELESLPVELRARARTLAGEVRAAAATDDLRRLAEVRELDLLPLTRTQALRVNAELAVGAALRPGLLSPAQEALRRELLAAPAERFEGLRRPQQQPDLGAYQAELRRRLDSGR
jgi:hypothetical protein